MPWLRAVLLRRPTATGERRRRPNRRPEGAGRRPRRHRRPRGQLVPAVRRRASCVRVGRYGPYLEHARRGQRRANVPDDLPPDELTVEQAEELLRQPSGGRELGTDPETGRPIVAKAGRFGPYVTEVLPDGRPRRPARRQAAHRVAVQVDVPGHGHARRRAQLLSLPRVVGTDRRTASEITAQNGRYGPYLKKGTDTPLAGAARSSSSRHPRRGAGDLRPAQAARPAPAAAPPLQELGTDPVSGKPMVVKDGRFGPYVTDGETNATLRKGDDVETITARAGRRAARRPRARLRRRPRRGTATPGRKQPPPARWA